MRCGFSVVIILGFIASFVFLVSTESWCCCRINVKSWVFWRCFQQNSPGAHTTRSTYGASLPKFEQYYENLGVETKNLKLLWPIGCCKFLSKYQRTKCQIQRRPSSLASGSSSRPSAGSRWMRGETQPRCVSIPWSCSSAERSLSKGHDRRR